MGKKGIAVLMTLCLLLGMAAAAAEGTEIDWTAEQRSRLKVGNTTAMRGRFFTGMWGGTTSDLDAQDLLHAYSLARYEIEDNQFEFDRSVVQDVAVLGDKAGNRTYVIVLYDDMKWSDGTPVTAYDYAFSILFCMDPAIRETGGTPMDYSWIAGAEEYLSGKNETVTGLRVINEQMMEITVKAEALPYFYELSRLMIYPYPAKILAPGIKVSDIGNGARLSAPLTAETIRETVLDGQTGYLTYPTVVSGPYTLISFDGMTATFQINPYFKGTEEGMVPRIGEIEYTLANNVNMIDLLIRGEFDLLDKVTMGNEIRYGIGSVSESLEALALQYEPRVGLTIIKFREDSPKIQETTVRQAIACCFDRDAFVKDYTGAYGMRMDGLYGLGQWPYRLAAGMLKLPGDDGDEEQQTAGQEITLDGLVTYKLNTAAAVRLLEKTGWNLNEKGEPFEAGKDTIRYKQTGGTLTGLDLTLAMPDSADARAAMEKHLAAHLREAGIGLTITPISMDNVEEIYFEDGENPYDMLYLGEDFTIYLDPEILAPETETEGELHSTRAELYQMALDMVRTKPQDVEGFLRKWVKLQERITETLPVIPVYSNVYFDFFSRKLHNYDITSAVTWGEAIVRAYMSDMEEIDEEEAARRRKEIEEAKKPFETPEPEATPGPEETPAAAEAPAESRAEQPDDGRN